MKALSVLIPCISLAVLGLLSACEEDPSGGSPSTQPSIDPALDGSAGVGDGATSPKVTVAALRAVAPGSGLPVIAHNADGTPFGDPVLTDATGRAVVAIPAGGLVTVLTGTSTDHRLVTYTGVQDGDVLAVRDFQTFDITMSVGEEGFPDLPQGSENFGSTIGIGCTTSTLSAPPATASLRGTSDCMRANEFAAVNVINYGTESYAVWRRNVAIAPSGTTAVNDLTPFVHLDQSVTVNFVGGTTNNAIFLHQIANGGLFPAFSSDPVGTEAVRFFVMPGFAEAYELEYNEPKQNLPLLANRRILTRFATTTPPPSIDAATAPMLPYIATFDVDISVPARPRFTFSGEAPLTTTDGGGTAIDWKEGEVSSTWSIVVPSSATTVTAPALPPAYAAWAPSPAAKFASPRIAFVESDAIKSYGDLRAGAGALQPGVIAALPVALPVDGTYRVTSASRTDL